MHLSSKKVIYVHVIIFEKITWHKWKFMYTEYSNELYQFLQPRSSHPKTVPKLRNPCLFPCRVANGQDKHWLVILHISGYTILQWHMCFKLNHFLKMFSNPSSVFKSAFKSASERTVLQVSWGLITLFQICCLSEMLALFLAFTL